jgi:outer membrane protein assembly factor BamB
VKVFPVLYSQIAKLIALAWLPAMVLVVAAQAETAAAPSGDWPQWGGSPARNNTPIGQNIPVTWNVGTFDQRSGRWLGSPDKQIRWVAKLGGESYGSPVVADGQVYCATNNGAGYLPRYPASVDLGCLLAFAAADGRFLWQHSVEKLSGRSIDWPKQGICCSPLVEGKRLWTVTNRGEVVCLDTQPSRDGRASGPVNAKPSAGPNDSHLVWSFDMMRRLGVVQRYMCSCSVTAAGDLLLVNTSNGVDTDDKLPAPEAPSFIALNKHSGELIWADHSPGRNILEGQWSSPAFAVLGGVPQAIFAGGDGWLYSFVAEPAPDRQPRLLWKFDANPKDAVWKGGGNGRRNHIIATPVIHDGRVYIGTGQDPEAGEGPGDLWCIDPARRGDVSAEVVVDRRGKPVSPRRLQAVDKDAGEQVRPNPNSAAVWHYRGPQTKSAGADDFKKTMHRTLGTGAIRDGLLVVGDFAGLVHCLDARTGQVQWTYDTMAAIWGGPLIVEGKVYLGNEDGDVLVFELGRSFKLLAKNNMANSVFSSPVVAHNVLYISTRGHLFAIARGRD